MHTTYSSCHLLSSLICSLSLLFFFSLSTYIYLVDFLLPAVLHLNLCYVVVFATSYGNFHYPVNMCPFESVTLLFSLSLEQDEWIKCVYLLVTWVTFTFIRHTWRCQGKINIPLWCFHRCFASLIFFKSSSVSPARRVTFNHQKWKNKSQFVDTVCQCNIDLSSLKVLCSFLCSFFCLFHFPVTPWSACRGTAGLTPHFLVFHWRPLIDWFAWITRPLCDVFHSFNCRC